MQGSRRFLRRRPRSPTPAQRSWRARRRVAPPRPTSCCGRAGGGDALGPCGFSLSLRAGPPFASVLRGRRVDPRGVCSSYLQKRRDTMEYLLLIYDEEKRFANLKKPDFDTELSQYRAFGTEFAKNIRGGNALQPTSAATTVRLRNGKRMTTDGPFAE